MIPQQPRMPQPRKALSELLSKDGDRVFTLTEKQFFGIVNGWTHLELMDEKSIFESIYDTRTPRPAPSPSSITTLCYHYSSGWKGACGNKDNPEHGCSWKCPVDGDYFKCPIIAAQAREKMMKLICEQCPVRNEEMPLEDYSAESCAGCLTRKVYESLRTGGGPR
jgi:hypothetical protein